MKYIKILSLYIFVFAFLSGEAIAQMRDDRSEKGPYEQRHFSREIGSPMAPAIQGGFTSMPAVELLVDDKGSGETNELIVLLNYANIENLRKILSPANPGAVGATPPAIERTLVAAVLSQGRNLDSILKGAVYARFLINKDRMSDETRAHEAAAGSPRERMERYIVLRYPSVAAAQEAKKHMERFPDVFTGIENNRVGVVISWMPNDPYFSSPAVFGGSSSVPAQYQWGMQIMNFPQAWDRARGHAQIGLLDAGYPGTYSPSGIVPHPDLVANYRKQFVPGKLSNTNPVGDTLQYYKGYNDHTTHVFGIIAAQTNNGNYTIPSQPTGGVAGGCTNCSITVFPIINNTEIVTEYSSGGALADCIKAINKAVETGMQVLNWSGSWGRTETCGSSAALCDALSNASQSDMLIVEATGNFMYNESQLLSPLNMASSFSILPVGGIQPSSSGTWSRWIYDSGNGSSVATMNGVVAPAKSIVSTISANSAYLGLPNYPYAMCGDSSNSDESGTRYLNGYGDGVGSCTGTSMAAPHVSALAGLIRSINPRLTANQVRQIIQQSGNLANAPTVELGHGLPNALTAVNAAIATNPTRLTPLFSFYSSARTDSFYTTVPQMANAALDGTLMPRMQNDSSANGTYSSAYGSHINGYDLFPGRSPFVPGPSPMATPLAQVWLFTTHENPMNTAVPLEPLYRMSWKCGDATPYPPALCTSQPRHIDTVLVNQSELGYFQWLGYQTDGLEGYVYPKTLAQPLGTVRLMRKFHRSHDDHAVFPETTLIAMQGQGYNEDTNYNDWLGYVYPNVSGSMPAIEYPSVITATTTALTGSPNPAKVGETVTLTATITGNSPSGTVTFKNASTTLGTAALSGGMATLTTSFTSDGNYSLTASYGGDAANAASTSAVLSLPVNKTASAITVTATPNPAVVNLTVTLKATVTGNAPSGTVTFKNASTILGTAPLVAGEATLTTSFASVGNRSITASYDGNAANTASASAALNLAVNLSSGTTTTLTGSPNPAKVGETVTLTATITGSSPSGTVTFKSASTLLGTVPLSGGVATLTWNFTSAGNRSLTAIYSGDAANTASTSAVFSLPVNKTASAIMVTATPNPAAVNQTVMLKATVTGNAPSGTVTFKSASTILGTAPLVAGEATLTTSFASVGNRSITASYGGDTSNTVSASAALSLPINATMGSVSMPTYMVPDAANDSVFYVLAANGR